MEIVRLHITLADQYETKPSQDLLLNTFKIDSSCCYEINSFFEYSV